MNSRTIYKYNMPLRDGDWHSILMPEFATIIHVGAQEQNICLWAIVDPLADRVARRFEIIGTGIQFDQDPLAYVGSVQMVSENEWGRNEFVWHVFERIQV